MSTSQQPFLCLHYSSPIGVEQQNNNDGQAAGIDVIELPKGRFSLVGSTSFESFAAASQAVKKAVRSTEGTAFVTNELIEGFQSRNVRSVLETIAGFWGIASIRRFTNTILDGRNIKARTGWHALSPIERMLLLVDLSQNCDGIVVVSPESFLTKTELDELASKLREDAHDEWSVAILSSYPELCRNFADHVVMLDLPRASQSEIKKDAGQRILKGAVKADEPVFVLELSGVSPNELEEDLQSLDLPMWKSTETSGYSVSLFFEDCAAVQPWLKYAGERDILVMRMDDSAPNLQGEYQS